MRGDTVTRPEEYSVIQDVVKLLADDGFNALGEALRRIINQAMQLERQQHLGVGPYERSDARNGYANGFKPKPFRRGSEPLIWTSPKSGTAVFIRPAWRKDCAPNAP